MAELEDDSSLNIEIISFESGMNYLEAHIFYNGEWRIFPWFQKFKISTNKNMIMAQYDFYQYENVLFRNESGLQ